MELRETIDLEVERLGLPGLRTELAALQQELWALGRQGEELQVAISLWDRWMIFSDTPAEAQVKDTRERAAQVERSLAFVRKQLDAAHAQLGELCPPFAVALGLCECLPLAYTGVTVEGWLLKRVAGGGDLRAALTELAGLLRRTYFPSLDFAALRARLADAGACQALSGLAERPLPGSSRLGHAPLDGDAPLGKVAEALLDNGFFAARYREEELLARCAGLVETMDSADAAISLWDRVNVFTKTADEQTFAAASAELQAAEEELRKIVERQQSLQHAAMRAYPPLDFYHGVVEALGIAGLLHTAKEPVITALGEVEQRAVVAPRALLLAAVRRLQSVFAATFPGVPSPQELRVRVSAEQPGLHGDPRAAAFVAEAAKSTRLSALREEALLHAGMVGQLGRELAEVRGNISLIDRLVFWSDTDAEKSARILAGRSEANEAWTRRLWQAMLQEARVIGAGIGPLAVRDAAVPVGPLIAAIHTDGGSSSFPKNCSVYGREEAMAAVHAVAGVFARIYGLRGAPRDLLRVTVAAKPVAHVVYEDPVQAFTPLAPEAVAELLAARAQSSGLAEMYAAVASQQVELEQTDQEREAVKEKISLWDTINVFKTTEDEARYKDLKTQVGGMARREAMLRERLWELFEAALAGYPPGLLWAELARVVDAIDEIRAVCESYTVTTGTGNNRRTETRYRCSLLGKDEAVEAMTRWSARMVAVFGEQLGYHELLEALELEPAPEEALPQS